MIAAPVHDTGGVPERPAGVVRAWVTASARASEAVMADLWDCVAGLDVVRDERWDTVGRWLVLDWLVRAAAPRWLRAVGLDRHAGALRGLPALGSHEALSAAATSVQGAVDAAEGVHGRVWGGLVAQAEQHGQTAGSPEWLALVDGARLAIGAIRLVVDPASQVVGWPADGGGPTAWRAAVGSITHAAGAIVWDAVAAMTAWAAWSWHMPPTAIRGLAYTTARTALAPVETATHGSTCQLLATMHALPARNVGDRS